MATTEDDLKSFNHFVHQRLSSKARGASLAELFDLWLLENPDAADYAENVAAINASIEDFQRGERGTLAGEHSREFRKEFGITDG